MKKHFPNLIKRLSLIVLLFHANVAYSICNFGAFPNYEKQATGWFYQGQRVPSGPGFRVIDESTTLCGNTSRYAMDDSQAFFKGKIIPGADSKTFDFIKNGEQSEYTKDKSNVFYDDKKIVNADPQTIIYIGYRYAKDKSKVFFEDKEIKDADVTSFTPLVIEDPLSKDKFHIFYGENIVRGAAIKGEITPIRGFGSGYWSDDKRVFYQSKLLPDAVKTTFKPLVFITGGEDQTHYFFRENSFKKSDCPFVGKYIFQCGKNFYQALPPLFNPTTLDVDLTSFHRLQSWTGHCDRGNMGSGTEVYQDSHGVYLANTFPSMFGIEKYWHPELQKIVDLKHLPRLDEINNETKHLICMTTTYTPVKSLYEQ